jgi:HlyD family secretion protein
MVALAFLAGVGSTVAYFARRAEPAPPIVGIVRSTEIRIAPEVGGQLESVKVRTGGRVRAGDTLAQLSALELTAAVEQARAALAAAVASRDNVYAGVRKEEIAGLAAQIDKAKSRLAYAQLQLDRAAYLARDAIASQQTLDQAENDAATARADAAEAEANHAAAVAGPTKEERAIADVQVEAAAAALAVLERRLAKTTLRAPEDGVVGVIVAEVGEAVSAGQPVLVIEAAGKKWMSFNAREDWLRGIAVGTTVQVRSQDVTTADTSSAIPALVTELVPLGSFATWQAERAVGDHDRNTLRLRLDPTGGSVQLTPGQTVWIAR